MIKKIICFLIGHLLIENHYALVGYCTRCERKYKISYDMSYGETIIIKEIK